MHYYQHHIGDFIKDTSFLTNEEVGIYMKLIWLYYDSEQPLKDDIFALSMKTNARDSEDAVKGILAMFFVLQEGEWHHTRCDKEIAEYAEYCSKQRANGLKGGRPSVTKDKPTANPPLTQGQPKETLTTNHKPLTTNHNKNIGTPSGVAESVWNDYLKVRKAAKKPITETALKGLVREADKAKLSLEQALTICIERSWVGFNAEWVNKATAPTARKEDKQWMFSDAGIDAKAKELGIAPYGHDTYNTLKERIIRTIAERSMR